VPISNLSWTLARDQRDRPAAGTPAWLPLPLNNTVDVFVFLGVPYAEKPIGERRFKVSSFESLFMIKSVLQPPQKLTRFGDNDQGVVRAFKYSSACVQDIDRRPTLGWHVPYEYNTDEDCLYLNIFSPQVQTLAIASLIPCAG
jgi:carboxylesterase type B